MADAGLSQFSPTLQKKIKDSMTEPIAPTKVPVSEQRDTPGTNLSGNWSKKRQAALAKINAAILAANEQEKPALNAYQDTGLLAPPPSLATPAQKEEAKAQIAAQAANDRYQEEQKSKLSKEQEAILKAQEKLLGEEEAKRLREEQEQQAARSQLVKGAERTLKNAQGIVHGADVRIGSVPQPGGIAVPLILLLLFFFILIQVNGSSRLGHLWRVITGAERLGNVDLTVTGPGPGSVDTGRPTVNEPTESHPATTTGQGGEQSFSVGLYPILPANGVFALNGMY